MDPSLLPQILEIAVPSFPVQNPRYDSNVHERRLADDADDVLLQPVHHELVGVLSLSRDFQLFLLGGFFGNAGGLLGTRALAAAADLFEAQALIDGVESPVHLRVADRTGALDLDLRDSPWRAFEVDPSELARGGPCAGPVRRACDSQSSPWPGAFQD